MAKKLGLPDGLRMRHNYHLIDEIVQRTRTPVVRIIPIDKIVPSEMQPRKDMGILDELAESIKENGLIEPIIVRPKDGHFEIVAGERRFRAAGQAGLKEIPCIEHDVPDNEALEISIIENIQRKDLNLFEEAHSLKTLSEAYGYSHEEIAHKVSRSRVTVSEVIRLCDIPLAIQARCKELNIHSKTFLLELVKLESFDKMNEVLDQYQKKSFSRDEIKKERKGKGKINPQQRVKFHFISDDKNIKVQFYLKEKCSKDSLVEWLIKLIDDIKAGNLKELP